MRVGSETEANQGPHHSFALALGLAACQRGFSVVFTTAAALVHQLMEARDEKRLLRLQAQLDATKLLIVDLCAARKSRTTS
jgi:DNA replication protein DnaC